MFVQVVVNLPLKNVFDYSVPVFLQKDVVVGKRVWVPFRNRVIVGVIVNILALSNFKKTRPIKSIIDEDVSL